MTIGWTEGLLVIGIALVVFGPGKLPGVGKAFGEAIRGFKQEKDVSDDQQKAKEDK